MKKNRKDHFLINITYKEFFYYNFLFLHNKNNSGFSLLILLKWIKILIYQEKNYYLYLKGFRTSESLIYFFSKLNFVLIESFFNNIFF